MSESIQQQDSPATRRRLKIRNKIVEAAECVFAEEGEAGLSIRRLADAIDYSPAAIYKYFASKDDIIDELKETFFERLISSADTLSKDDAPFIEMAQKSVAAYIATALEKPHHYAAAFSTVHKSQNCPFQNKRADFADSHKGKAFKYLTDMVQQGILEGHFRSDIDPVIGAKSIWASMHGLAHLMIHLPPMQQTGMGITISNHNLAQVHAELVIRGLQIAPDGAAT